MLINSNKNMTIKKYQKIRILIIVSISIIFSQSIIYKNFFIPVVTLLISSLLLVYLRKKVDQVIADERDYEIGGRSALLTIQIYSWIAVIVMFLLYAIQDYNIHYESIAMTLAFSTCLLMIIYSFIFRFYSKIKLEGWNIRYVFFIALFLILIVMFAMRLFSAEDNWLCENGEWIKHGNPSSEKPTIECKKNDL